MGRNKFISLFPLTTTIEKTKAQSGGQIHQLACRGLPSNLITVLFGPHSAPIFSNSNLAADQSTGKCKCLTGYLRTNLDLMINDPRTGVRRAWGRVLIKQAFPFPSTASRRPPRCHFELLRHCFTRQKGYTIYLLIHDSIVCRSEMRRRLCPRMEDVLGGGREINL